MFIFLAIQILQVVWTGLFRKTALDNCEKFNVHVVNSVLNKFYIDDYLDSFDNLDEAITSVLDITGLLTFGGFNLAKCISNNRLILKNLGCEFRSSRITHIHSAGNYLGLQYRYA